MTLLYISLVLSTLALLGAALAGYVLVRRQMRMKASDAALRTALEEMESERVGTES